MSPKEKSWEKLKRMYPSYHFRFKVYDDMLDVSDVNHIVDLVSWGTRPEIIDAWLDEKRDILFPALVARSKWERIKMSPSTFRGFYNVERRNNSRWQAVKNAFNLLLISFENEKFR